MKSDNFKRIILIFTGFCATGVMLTLIQAPLSIDYLAWTSLVPLVLLSNDKSKPGQLILAGYITCFCYWLINLYWLGFVTAAGWIAFCLYMGCYWPVLSVLLRFCRCRAIPMIIAVPVLVVGAESFQAVILGGFGWRYLAHSQYENIRLIQIADIFGTAGVSFLIAMVNGALVDMILNISKKSAVSAGNITGNIIRIAVVACAITAALLYGCQRVNQTPGYVSEGPLIASVQCNIPLRVKESGLAEVHILADLLRQSTAASNSKAELIVWPETMVQTTLDERFLLLCDPCHPARIFDAVLGEHAKDRAYILVGSYAGKPAVIDGKNYLVERYNSAFLYRPDGYQDPNHYDKIHIVPFGEYVPFKESLPSLHKWLLKLTPYEYDYSLNQGSNYTVFNMAGKPHDYRFAVLICYEDTIAGIARHFALNKNNKKRIDWLVNISNDGWFVRFCGGDVSASTELVQHTAICVFRAVENRLAVVRSVNTGISCLIDSLGRIKNGYLSGNLPMKAMDRQGVAGWFVDRVDIDKRVTFFSRYGQVLDPACAALLLLTALWALRIWLQNRKASCPRSRFSESPA
ncbi:MAG: apolipoprotein N-acyltransferase [Planctomycetota bacterium]